MCFFLEAIAYNQCDALNRAVFDLAPGAEMMAWDLTAFGLPAADMPFVQGTFRQHLEIPVRLQKKSKNSYIPSTKIRIQSSRYHII